MTEMESVAEKGADEYCKQFFNGCTDTKLLEMVRLAYKFGFMVGGSKTIDHIFKDKRS